MIKAFFVDFYGTLVHEDGAVIKEITDIICNTGKVENRKDVGAFWWNDFQTMFTNSFGDGFETQRKLERKSLENTLNKFHSSEDADRLSNLMFEHWVKPPIFDDTKDFFDRSPIPIYILYRILIQQTSWLPYHFMVYLRQVSLHRKMQGRISLEQNCFL